MWLVLVMTTLAPPTPALLFLTVPVTVAEIFDRSKFAIASPLFATAGLARLTSRLWGLHPFPDAVTVHGPSTGRSGMTYVPTVP